MVQIRKFRFHSYIRSSEQAYSHDLQLSADATSTAQAGLPRTVAVSELAVRIEGLPAVYSSFPLLLDMVRLRTTQSIGYCGSGAVQVTVDQIVAVTIVFPGGQSRKLARSRQRSLFFRMLRHWSWIARITTSRRIGRSTLHRRTVPSVEHHRTWA
jgi:hypothetical protein